MIFFFFSSRRRHTRLQGDWSSDVCSSDLPGDQQRSPAHRSDRRAHQQGRGSGLPAAREELRGGVRGAADPQGLRRWPVARRLRRAAGRVRCAAGGGGAGMTGFQLARLELYNWGTFGGRVWSLGLEGQNTLLTGDIGSGKSTIVDAVTTLLLPAQRISYNKAAGADTRERSLRSYVLGYYKTERNEVTGTAKPVALRNDTKHSVILGVFHNEGYDEAVTLAQVFYVRAGDPAGQPGRFYVAADRAL